MIEKKKQMTIRHCKLLLEKKRKIKLVSNEMQFMVRRTKKKPNEQRIKSMKAKSSDIENDVTAQQISAEKRGREKFTRCSF